VSEVHCVIFIVELAAECQCEIVALSLFFHTVLVIAYVFACTDPALSEFLCLYSTVL